MASVFLCTTLFAFSAAAFPDLAVATIATGAPSFISASEANLPLTITITNHGDATALRFKLSVDVIDSSGRFVKPFTVPAQTDRWYPWKIGLARGASYSFRGTLYVGKPGGPTLHGQRISIIPRVDSCSGDEFARPYCRVQESSEGNNEIARVVAIP